MTGSREVVVNRCTVTVVRHGGWSWGPQPRRLTDQVLAALPALIANRFANLAAGGDDMEVTERVRIAVRLPLADLLAAPHAPAAAAAIATADGPAEIMPLTTGVVSPAGHAADSEADPMSPAGRAVDRGAKTAPPAARAGPAPTSLLQLLVDLSRGGHLDLLLSMLPQAMLDAWYRALFGLAGGEPPSTGTTSFADELNRLHKRGELAALAAVLPPATRQAWRLALLSAVGVDPAPMLAVLAHATDGGPGTGTRTETSGSLAAVAALAARVGVNEIERLLRVPANAPAGPPVAAISAPARPADVEIDCVLPFLFLGPLARAGYLGAIGPALDVVGLADAAGLFAAALTATVVPPAAPRPPSAPGDDLSAVFAGLPAPPSPAALGTFAERASPALPALNAILTTSLVLGHEKVIPLLLTTGNGAADGYLLLADIEGLFPMTWPESVEDVLVTWRACGSPVLMVAPPAARNAVLRQLDEAGVRFVVDMPPTRGERWHRLPGPDQVWTNHPTPLPGHPASWLPWAPDQLRTLVTHLTPAQVPDPALSRAVVLAAAFALGTIAWTLWRHRETAHPALALARFGDLSARVQSDAESVHVWLPLGPRHADLRDHGLLADVPGVPWLGGRVVRFYGG